MERATAELRLGRQPSVQTMRKLLSAHGSEKNEGGSSTSKVPGGIEQTTAETNQGTVQCENQPKLTYIISLAPFERLLLKSTADTWSLKPSRSETNEEHIRLRYLFNQWDWSFEIQSFLCEAFEENNGPRDAVYEDTLYSLGRMTPPAYGRRLFRIDQLRADNPDFVRKLSNRPFSHVEFIPSEQDMDYWRILDAMYCTVPKEMEVWTNIVRRRELYHPYDSFWTIWCCQYEIWKVVRMFNLRKRRPDNAERIFEIFCDPESGPIYRMTLRAEVRTTDATGLSYEVVRSEDPTVVNRVKVNESARPSKAGQPSSESLERVYLFDDNDNKLEGSSIASDVRPNEADDQEHEDGLPEGDPPSSGLLHSEKMVQHSWVCGVNANVFHSPLTAPSIQCS